MTPTQPKVSVTGHVDNIGTVSLLLTEGDIKFMAENPEHVIAEIKLRATQMGSILEGILQEPHSHGHSDWGIND